MNRKLLVGVAALVASTMFSGCFFMRELNWTHDRVEPGRGTTAEVGLMATESSPSRFFIMAFGPSELDQGVVIRNARFDIRGALGKTRKMKRDPELAEAIIDDGVCDELPISLPIVGEPVVFRTGPNVSANEGRLVWSKFRAKVAEEAPGGAFGGIVFTGAWHDDGDGQPESEDDGIACTGFATTSFRVKGPFDVPSPREVLR